MHAAPQHPDPVEAITGLHDMAFLNAQTLTPLKALRPRTCRPHVSDISVDAQTLVRLCGQSPCSSTAADADYGFFGGTNFGVLLTVGQDTHVERRPRRRATIALAADLTRRP